MFARKSEMYVVIESSLLHFVSTVMLIQESMFLFTYYLEIVWVLS